MTVPIPADLEMSSDAAALGDPVGAADEEEDVVELEDVVLLDGDGVGAGEELLLFPQGSGDGIGSGNEMDEPDAIGGTGVGWTDGVGSLPGSEAGG